MSPKSQWIIDNIFTFSMDGFYSKELFDDTSQQPIISSSDDYLLSSVVIFCKLGLIKSTANSFWVRIHGPSTGKIAIDSKETF